MKRRGHRSFQVGAMIAAFFVHYHRVPSLAAAEQPLTEQEHREGRLREKKPCLLSSRAIDSTSIVVPRNKNEVLSFREV
jgi:hypothetical protein